MFKEFYEKQIFSNSYFSYVYSFSACSSNSVKNEENTSKEHAPDKIVLDHAFGQTILDKNLKELQLLLGEIMM